MKRLEYLLFIIVISIFYFKNIHAQISIEGVPKSYKDNILISESIPTIILPELDIQSILAQDKLSSDTALRIGRLIDVDIDLIKNSVVSCSVDETLVYRLKIIAPKAKAIELIFDSFFIPEGGKLFVHNPDYSEIAGAFTSNNNTKNKKFAIHAIRGDEVIIEYEESKDTSLTAILHLKYVCYIYIDIDQSITKKSTYQTNCFLDVHCIPNRNEPRSVIRW